MNKMKELAVAVLAVAGLSGCASTRVAEPAGADAAQPPVAQKKVMRALPSYGSMGGYRYRRFTVVAASS
jgi:hypothetical protein